MSDTDQGLLAGSNAVDIIEKVHQGGYFALAALIVIVYFLKKPENISREVSLLMFAMLAMGAIPFVLPPPAVAQPKPCVVPKISVSLEPESFNQITYAMNLGGAFPSPKLLLSGRPACAGPVPGPDCPRFGVEFPMESDHEIVRVSMSEAFDAIHKRVADDGIIIRELTAGGFKK